MKKSVFYITALLAGACTQGVPNHQMALEQCAGTQDVAGCMKQQNYDLRGVVYHQPHDYPRMKKEQQRL